MRRRSFLGVLANATLGGAAGGLAGGFAAAEPAPARSRRTQAADAVTLLLCGDVMLGRGIDQILPHPSDPVLYESFVKDARGYVALAERQNGPVARAVAWPYVWGDALAELERWAPDARIVNLETSVTRSRAPWPGKAIHYRMHPGNVPCLTAAGIDCCVLANNHVLDWSRPGLDETLATLRTAGIATAGAGADLAAAQAPAILPLASGARVLVFAAATWDAGVPPTWVATASRSGVQRLPDLSTRTLKTVATDVLRHRQDGDCVVFSLHWGDNWGYEIAPDQRAFAHALIDEAGVDVVHGHSSHHPRAIEVHGDRPILYGCGDFLNDYEGITGNDEFRGDLGLMYFPQFDRAGGHLRELIMVPTRIRHLRVNRADGTDRRWLLARMRRECRRFDCDLEPIEDGAFALRW